MAEAVVERRGECEWSSDAGGEQQWTLGDGCVRVGGGSGVRAAASRSDGRARTRRRPSSSTATTTTTASSGADATRDATAAAAAADDDDGRGADGAYGGALGHCACDSAAHRANVCFFCI